MWIEQGVSGASAASIPTVEVDLCDLGVVVIAADGRVRSADAHVRALLHADSTAVLDERVREIRCRLAEQRHDDDRSSVEARVALRGLDPLAVRVCPVEGQDGDAVVLLIRDARAVPATARLLQQAARQRSFAFLARDWAHDLKGMLHVIRINSALIGRLLQRDGGAVDPAVARCLDAIPREVDRLDRAIDLSLGTRTGEQTKTFDVVATCGRVVTLIAARASRQRVEIAFDRTGMHEIVGREDDIQTAILNVMINGLEAMPEEGRLSVSVDGGADGVTVHVSDTGLGLTRQSPRLWQPQLATDDRQTAIGLHVARTIVESHGGHIACTSNVPHGTCVDITLPTAASTGRLENGSRTHRR